MSERNSIKIVSRIAIYRVNSSHLIKRELMTSAFAVVTYPETTQHASDSELKKLLFACKKKKKREKCNVIDSSYQIDHEIQFALKS